MEVNTNDSPKIIADGALSYPESFMRFCTTEETTKYKDTVLSQVMHLNGAAPLEWNCDT